MVFFSSHFTHIALKEKKLAIVYIKFIQCWMILTTNQKVKSSSQYFDWCDVQFMSDKSPQKCVFEGWGVGAAL